MTPFLQISPPSFRTWIGRKIVIFREFDSSPPFSSDVMTQTRFLKNEYREIYEVCFLDHPGYLVVSTNVLPRKFPHPKLRWYPSRCFLYWLLDCSFEGTSPTSSEYTTNCKWEGNIGVCAVREGIYIERIWSELLFFCELLVQLLGIFLYALGPLEPTFEKLK